MTITILIEKARNKQLDGKKLVYNTETKIAKIGRSKVEYRVCFFRRPPFDGRPFTIHKLESKYSGKWIEKYRIISN